MNLITILPISKSLLMMIQLWNQVVHVSITSLPFVITTLPHHGSMRFQKFLYAASTHSMIRTQKKVWDSPNLMI